MDVPQLVDGPAVFAAHPLGVDQPQPTGHLELDGELTAHRCGDRGSGVEDSIAEWIGRAT